MSHLIDIVIPSFNSPHLLFPCVKSILQNRATPDLCRIIVVNNGHPDSVKGLEGPDITVLQMPENRGWEGGLKAGLEVSKAPFVVFMNDDTLVPPSSRMWLNQMLNHFRYPDCAGVGPSSNFVMGPQNIFIDWPYAISRTTYLIGFCVMYRREHLDLVGGVDDSHPYHGDDLDLGMRLRKAGKYLVCNREIFIFHHGSQTGVRDFNKYWNSAEMENKTMTHLVKKHGLREYLYTITNPPQKPVVDTEQDREGTLIRKYLTDGKILDLGCGPSKTVPHAVGMDIVPKGEVVPGLGPTDISQADVVGDVTQKLPFDREFDFVIARHILEHCLDPIGTISNWEAVLKPGGRLIIAVPDQGINNTIPMNWQHVCAYTKETLPKLMETLGWRTIAVEDPENRVSFVGIFEKEPVDIVSHTNGTGVMHYV